MGIQSPSENPCEASLGRIHGSLKGTGGSFEAYIAQIRGEDRKVRLSAVMESRIAEPATTPAFRLDTIDGMSVASDDLAGKVAVINFWGVWCGWCVRELPDLQKLHEKYREDPEVVILTINNDRDPKTVLPWMEKHGYDFTVLLDDGYVASHAGISSFPTTWFLDPDRKIAFKKDGWTKELGEEFGWRIDALRRE